LAATEQTTHIWRWHRGPIGVFVDKIMDVAAPKLIIKLDREDKFYFPGEIVTGSVFLSVPVVTKCVGGVYLDFSARAASAWMVEEDGQGDTKKKLMSGETVFQHEIRTVTGKTFQTGSYGTNGLKDGPVDEAVDFDHFPGSGILYIPCQKLNINAMKFKLEANGAEAVIHVSKLVEKPDEKQIIYMTSKVGNMRKGSVIISARFEPYSTIYANAPTDGMCEYDMCLIFRVHRLRGVKKGTTNMRVLVHDWVDVPEMRFDRSSHNDVTLDIVPEQVYPFFFQLRNDAPGSASWKVGPDTSSVSYSLKAFVDINKKLSVTGVHFTVLANRPLPRPSLISPYKMETGDQPLHQACQCFCWPRRTAYTVSMKLHIARLAYAPGEMIDLTGSTVVNNSMEPQRVQIVLKTFIEQNNGLTATHSLTLDQVLFEAVIAEKQNIILTNLREFEGVRVPAVYPSYAGQYLAVDQKQRHNACVKWTYTLEIRLPDWGSGFYCRTPILISAVPPYTNQLQKYRKVKTDPVLAGQYSIFHHAISGIHNSCETGPTLSRGCDKGRKTLALYCVPAWMGGREHYVQWLKEESNRTRLMEWTAKGYVSDGADYADLMALFHCDKINVYAGPSGSFDETL
jgi:hypothetical protein